jgi:hypothetical protein
MPYIKDGYGNRIQLAVEDLKQRNNQLSLQQLVFYGVQQLTLYRRYHHQTSDRTHAQESRMNLKPSQEEAVINLI